MGLSDAEIKNPANSVGTEGNNCIDRPKDRNQQHQRKLGRGNGNDWGMYCIKMETFRPEGDGKTLRNMEDNRKRNDRNG